MMTTPRVRFPVVMIAASLALNSTASAFPSDQSLTTPVQPKSGSIAAGKCLARARLNDKVCGGLSRMMMEYQKLPNQEKREDRKVSSGDARLRVQLKGQALEHEILYIHNAERATVGSPALQWDPQLAQNATNYAAIIARGGQLVHASREGLGVERENLLRAPISYSPQQMMEVWTSERRYFVPGLFPNVSSTGNWADVGSYSQMIWPKTTSVGCGYAPGGGYNWLVCRYSPGGNKDGKPVGKST